MRLRDIAVLGIGALVLFQFVTSFAAINLLTRMSPSIEQVLAENVASIAAAEDMSAALISAGDAENRKKAFREALARAQKNVTEPAEAPLTAAIERQLDAAFNGDATALVLVSQSIRRLTEINRASMRRADQEAKRIGNAGAWTMALLGIFGFFAGVLVLRRILRALVAPIEELRRVLEAQLEGEPERRLGLRSVAPELQEVALLVNKMIDLRSKTEHRERWEIERSALLHLLDEIDAPAALLTRDHRKLATNRAMEALLQSDAHTRAAHALDQPFAPDSPPPGWTVTDIRGVALLLRKTP